MFKLLSLFIIAAFAFIMPVISIGLLVIWIAFSFYAMKNYKASNGDIVDIASTSNVLGSMAKNGSIGVTSMADMLKTSYVHTKHMNAKVKRREREYGIDLQLGFAAARPINARITKLGDIKRDRLAKQHLKELDALDAMVDAKLAAIKAAEIDPKAK